ncbi:hypothetical protein [Lysinibacillus xylanilyticus]|uniref:hypothetical protein n=1 Tax=Lysinibacillus xylanilyticus TaxID=582475 RepID=UPI00380281FE
MYKYRAQVYLTEGETLPFIEFELNSDSHVAAFNYLYSNTADKFLVFPFWENRVSFVARDKIKRIEIVRS